MIAVPALAAACVPAWAQAAPADADAMAPATQAEAEAPVGPALAAAAGSAPAPMIPVVRWAPPLRRGTSSLAGHYSARVTGLALQPSRLSVVALPPEGSTVLQPGRKAQHALSIRSDGPRKLLQALGVEASDCSMQFRMPTSINQLRSGGLSLEARAQARLACRF